MGIYLEFPEFFRHNPFSFRTLLNDGYIVLGPHWHREIEIIYAKKGNVSIGTNKHFFELEEGEIYMFSSGLPHYFLSSPNSERYVYQFDLELFNEEYYGSLTNKTLNDLFKLGEPHSKNWSPHLYSEVKRILLELFEADNSTNPTKHYTIMSLLFKLIEQLHLHLNLKEDNSSDLSFNRIQHKLEILNKIFDYIESHYQNEITLEDIARHAGFSCSYFTRFFKDNTGKSFMTFLTEYRINIAKYILLNEDYPVPIVAEKSGFSSIKTFHHVFKKKVGISPLQYKKNNTRNTRTF